MQTYKFDSETKEFICAEEAFLDPLETVQFVPMREPEIDAEGNEIPAEDDRLARLNEASQKIYLLPADSTFTEPLEAKDGYAVCWNVDKWEYREDHRGKFYWMPGDSWNTHPREMKVIGKLPDGAMLEKPEKPLETVRVDKLSELSTAFTTAESEAHLTSSLGIVINAGERAKRDIDALIQLLEYNTTIEAVDFCCYDNTYKRVTLADLKTMQIEVILSGNDLYAQKWAFRDFINAAQSKEELEALKIEFVFSDFSEQVESAE